VNKLNQYVWYLQTIETSQLHNFVGRRHGRFLSIPRFLVTTLGFLLVGRRHKANENEANEINQQGRNRTGRSFGHVCRALCFLACRHFGPPVASAIGATNPQESQSLRHHGYQQNKLCQIPSKLAAASTTTRRFKGHEDDGQESGNRCRDASHAGAVFGTIERFVNDLACIRFHVQMAKQTCRLVDAVQGRRIADIDKATGGYRHAGKDEGDEQ